ncbi:MAG TPA: hypothetical protein VJ698_11930 [Noviherbaspirillum sp.]|uniref:hypothetical protein n=1 Tax=Noviherbaspirillum sp. TaxID=1926288 RepID=UPI002B49C2BF|nr:hypothetical protein [Noviherbaspirillum sp.]HJV86173.1 hypothetical protein [Noviherbaspirillum sp.]
MKNTGEAILASAALALIAATPAHAGPPPWAPAHGHRAHQEEAQVVREYRYVYYPAQQVYYAPEQNMWFWMNGRNWQFGVNLPMQYRVSTGSGVQVMLASNRPYVQHAYVEETYGRPWRERHGHGERGHHHHRD